MSLSPYRKGVVQAPVIVDYDPHWPERFSHEEVTIRRALGGRLVGIEHIGSTAVPGLAAKPIVDLMVGLRHLREALDCIEPLAKLGYFQKADAPETEEWYFPKRPARGQQFNLHVVEHGGVYWRKKLLLRDYLRQRPDEAAQYAAVKRSLAPRFSAIRPYAQAKSAYILALLERAQAAAAGMEMAAEQALPWAGAGCALHA